MDVSPEKNSHTSELNTTEETGKGSSIQRTAKEEPQNCINYCSNMHENEGR